MPSRYSDADLARASQTLASVKETISQLTKWNQNISTVDDYYESQSGMQLLAANCTLITAIGEGVNRINKILPDFLSTTFPNIPWHAIISMRNHIAHGYFEIDADLVLEAVKNDIPSLFDAIVCALKICQSNTGLPIKRF